MERYKGSEGGSRQNNIGRHVSRLFKKTLVLTPSLFYEYNRKTNNCNYFEPITFTERDHFSHMEYSIEWWYFTGILNADLLKYPLGFEATFFRIASIGDCRILHTAVTDAKNGKFHNKSLYAVMYPALLNHRDPRHVHSFLGNCLYYDEECKKFHLRTKIQDLAIGLEMEPGAIMSQGTGGVLDDYYLDGGSYYYSLPNLKTSGRISYDGNTCDVSGMTWYDHQWGNFRLRDISWEWFSLRFDEQELYIMVFAFRKSASMVYSCNIMHRSRTEAADDVEVRPRNSIIAKNGLKYSSSWDIRIRTGNCTICLEIEPLMKEQCMNSLITPSYWEGLCKAKATFPDGMDICGEEFKPRTVLDGFAYVELIAEE